VVYRELLQLIVPCADGFLFVVDSGKRQRPKSTYVSVSSRPESCTSHIPPHPSCPFLWKKYEYEEGKHERKRKK
jgi:hypothetical protein